MFCPENHEITKKTRLRFTTFLMTKTKNKPGFCLRLEMSFYEQYFTIGENPCVPCGKKIKQRVHE